MKRVNLLPGDSCVVHQHDGPWIDFTAHGVDGQEISITCMSREAEIVVKSAEQRAAEVWRRIAGRHAVRALRASR